MSDPTDQGTTGPAPRGEAAWTQHRQGVADRNAAAAKAGKARRQAHEAEREARRRRIEALETTRFIAAGGR